MPSQRIMKSYLIFTLCVTVVSANSLLDQKSDSTEETVGNCLKNFGINPDVLDISAEHDNHLYEQLNSEQQGCVSACVYRGFGWLRKDGSLDIDTITGGFSPEDAEKVKNNIKKCRSEAGNNDCKFFKCWEKTSP